MPNLVVDFYRAGFLVRLLDLLPFLAWAAAQNNGPTRKLRKLGSLTFFCRLGSGAIDSTRRERLSRYPFSWARYAADGMRMQLFDAPARTIRSVAVQPDQTRLEQEMRIRRRMCDASPPVIDYDARGGWILEPWLKLKEQGFDLDLLKAAVSLLRQNLYEPLAVPVKDHVATLGGGIDADAVIRFLALRGLQTVQVSDVHGDLWHGNLCRDQQGRLLILDWEYTRSCGMSQDVWFFLAQRQIANNLPFDDQFMAAFAQSVTTCLDLSCDPAQARGLHLLHLAERFAFFRSLDLDHKKQELTMLSRAITDTLGSP